ncbi:hypothetical protein MVES1_000449 [Malassezia vespertilionis]|uniref:uncharacterized protein n=1 Tax=Malassezia vespertilionis TaxID=2020962 RepID=UPI0024B17112|nr:uncharacterized protein MVES1_000449 [Malassezia vespertilionis]WFD05123.1 hypothetical protein MVES1_000449 [Malassezia vespertilionis]
MTDSIRPLPNGIQLANDPVNLGGLKPEYHDVVVVGGGLSGVGLAIKLKTLYNITDVRILEKLDGPAGTWEANTYPGCACDIPAPVYSFSFMQKNDWSGMFPRQAEIREYVHSVVAKYGVGSMFHYRTVAREARFDSTTGLWHVICEDVPEKGQQTGKLHYYVAKMLFGCLGGLSQPNPCTIPGNENFKGPIFHSARWDHSVDLKNKNVIVVGNGCSATQFVPVIAPEVKHLTQFVRSKHWYAPVPRNPLDVVPGWNWLVKHFNFFMYLQRILIWLVLETHFLMATNTSIGQFQRDNWERQCRNHVKKIAPKEYQEQLLPEKGELLVACRRRILDDKYMPSLGRPNVDLVTDKLVKIESNAVVTADGRRIPADVIIMANGFYPQGAGFPLVVRGESMTLAQHWEKYGEGSMIAYRNCFLSGFPNFAMVIGPNSGTGHMSVIYTSERQQELTLNVAQPVLDSPRPTDADIRHLPGSSVSSKLSSVPTFDVHLKAELDEQHWVVKAMKSLVFGTCDSWYRDAKSGRVTAVYPDWQWKLALRCWFPVFEDFEYKHMPNNEKMPSIPFWQSVGRWFGLGTIPYVSPSETPEINRAAMGA